MQKKILMFVPTFPVLSETFIERDVDSMVRSRKIDVTVITARKGIEFRSKRAERVTELRRLTIKSSILSLRFLITRPARVFKAFRVLGIRHIYSFLKSLGYSKIFEEYSPDYIYAQFLSEPSSIALGASIILDIPLAISAHARDVLEYPDLVKEKVKHASFITFCNKNALKKAKELAEDVPTDNLKLVYHGVDVADLVPTRNLIKKPGQNFIFTIGRLTEKKGLKYLIGASEILKNRGVDHTIYIAGGGPLFSELEEEIDKVNLKDKVTLLGSTPFADVVQYLNLADLFVLPAINAAEGDADGVPNTLIEAAMLKIPIVTTHAGSIADFLDLDNAMIVRQHHAEGVADAIEKLLADKELGNRLSDAALLKAKELFDTEKSLKEIEDLFLK